MMNNEQREAYDNIINNRKCNFFITGSAGVGKSFLLEKLVEHYRDVYKDDCSVAVTAMTGLASMNIGGVTLHSWLGLGMEAKKQPSRYILNRYRKCKHLIVDEISMMSRELFERIYKYISNIQLIFFGDFFQLPPIDGEMVFHSQFWKDSIRTIVLNKIIRQSDERFIRVLNNIRWGTITDEDISWLKNFEKPVTNDCNYTSLYSVNVSVDYMNKGRLKDIGNKEFQLKAIDEYIGDNRYMKLLKNIMNKKVTEVIKIKVGAKVMTTKNDSTKRFVNGSVGIVTHISDSKVTVDILGNIVEIPRVSYIEKTNYAQLERKQFPIKLAWALTIHKSQGLTLTSLNLSTQNSFENGQCYVGISRVKSPDGLIIDNVQDLLDGNRVSLDVIKYYKSLQC